VCSSDLNPPVGAVVVSKGEIVGEGYHRQAGGPHAEAFALRSAGKKAKGATLYVTLEPCSTYGRTGPCTKLIIASRIRKIVIAVRDPNPAHRGRGIAILKKAGIKVVEGVCREEALTILKPFAKWITTGTPYITLKLGMSIDGRIADINRKSRWITSLSSRRNVLKLRQRVDAIMVGAGTVSADNPSLTCNRVLKPLRIIFDSRKSLSCRAIVFNDEHVARTVLVTSDECSDIKYRKFIPKGLRTWKFRSNICGQVPLNKVVSRLGKMGIMHVLCEGGGELAASLIRLGLVDEYLFFIAPIVLGGRNSVPSIGGSGWPLKSSPRLQFVEFNRSGDDIVICARPSKH